MARTTNLTRGQAPPHQAYRGNWYLASRYWSELLLVAIAATVYVIVQVVFLRPPALEGGDQLDYFSTANQLLDASPSHRGLRLGILLPTTLAIRAFGYSEAAYYAVPFLTGLALLLTTYLLGRLLFGRLVGLLAGVAIVLNPYVLWESSHLLPDGLAAACFTGGIVLLVYVGKRVHQNIHSSLALQLLAAGAGVLFAWAYLARELIALLFPVAFVVLLVYRIPWRCGVITASTAALVWAGELLWGWLVHGNPFVRFNAVLGRSLSPLTAAQQERLETQLEQGVHYTQLPVSDILAMLPRLFLERGFGGFYLALGGGFLAAGSVLLLRYRKELRFALLLAWAVGFWVILTGLGLMTDPSGRAVLRINKMRYWFPILPALLVGGFGVLGLLLERVRARLGRPVYFAGVSLVTVAVTGATLGGMASISHSGAFIKNGGGSHLREFRSWMATEGEEFASVWVDAAHGRAFAFLAPMYTRTTLGTPVWNGAISEFHDESGFRPMEDIDGPIIFNSVSISSLTGNASMPEDYEQLLMHGKIRFSSSNGSLLVVSPGGGSSWETLSQTGPTSEHPWMIVPRDGATYDERTSLDGGDLQLVDDDRVYLMDEGLAGVGPPDPESAWLLPGRLVRLEIQFETRGDGTVDPFCLFYNEAGERERISASPFPAMTGDHPGEHLFLCPTPSNGAGAFQFRAGIDVRGPLEMRVAEMHASALVE